MSLETVNKSLFLPLRKIQFFSYKSVLEWISKWKLNEWGLFLKVSEEEEEEDNTIKTK